MNFYILDENNELKKISYEEHIQTLTDTASQIKIERVGGFMVSTIFLRVCHEFHGSPPCLFETMIFHVGTGKFEEYQERCSTYKEALIQHEEAVEFAYNLESSK